MATLSKTRRLGVLCTAPFIAALAWPATAAPTVNFGAPAAGAATAVTPAEFGVYFSYGRPYRPHYGGYYGPYYRPHYYAPPPVTYYETRPYVVRPAAPLDHGDPDATARCASRFRSFNVNTGTYITHDGEERLCPYLR